MLFCGAVNGEPVNGAEQDRPMKEKQQRQNRQNPKATPPFSVWPRIFLLIIVHEHFILWTALERARERKRRRGMLPHVPGRAEARPSVLCASFPLGSGEVQVKVN